MTNFFLFRNLGYTKSQSHGNKKNKKIFFCGTAIAKNGNSVVIPAGIITSYGMGVWGAYGRMGYGMGYEIGMGLWDWGWDGVGLGLGYGRMGFGILPNPLVWAASIATVFKNNKNKSFILIMLFYKIIMTN